MSSIEPAANMNTKDDSINNTNKTLTNKSRKDAKLLNNQSSEKNDSFCEPTMEQDIEHAQVTDIPEFTIGPGGMTASVARQDKELKELSSKSSPNKDDEAPFKSL